MAITKQMSPSLCFVWPHRIHWPAISDLEFGWPRQLAREERSCCFWSFGWVQPTGAITLVCSFMESMERSWAECCRTSSLMWAKVFTLESKIFFLRSSSPQVERNLKTVMPSWSRDSGPFFLFFFCRVTNFLSSWQKIWSRWQFQLSSWPNFGHNDKKVLRHGLKARGPETQIW